MARTLSPEPVRYFSGRLLLAMPGIGDDNFEHATIAMCSHDEHGALGIDIGRTVPGLGLRALLANFDIDGSGVADVPVLRGGPVEPHRGFVLHSPDWEDASSMQVGAAWRLSGSLDVLKAIAAGTGPQLYAVALGYAGWAAGQLEQEMARHGWFLGGAFTGNLLSGPPAGRWRAAFAMNGIDARLLSGNSGSA